MINQNYYSSNDHNTSIKLCDYYVQLMELYARKPVWLAQTIISFLLFHAFVLPIKEMDLSIQMHQNVWIELKNSLKGWLTKI